MAKRGSNTIVSYRSAFRQPQVAIHMFWLITIRLYTFMISVVSNNYVIAIDII